MAYTVVKAFADLEDKMHMYRVGDEYPRHGFKPSESRLAMLMSNTNNVGVPFIERDIDKHADAPASTPEKPIKGAKEPDPVKYPSKRKTGVKRAKKADRGDA